MKVATENLGTMIHPNTVHSNYEIFCKIYKGHLNKNNCNSISYINLILSVQTSLCRLVNCDNLSQMSWLKTSQTSFKGRPDSGTPDVDAALVECPLYDNSTPAF